MILTGPDYSVICIADYILTFKREEKRTERKVVIEFEGSGWGIEYLNVNTEIK